MASELPPDWKTTKDSDGNTYFFNEATGETSWTLPEATSQPVPAAATAADREPSYSTYAPPLETAVAAPAPSGGGMAAEPAAELAAEPASTPSRPSEGQSRGSALAQSALAVVRPDALGDTVPKLLLILLASFVVMLQSALLFAHDQDAAQRGAEIYALIVGILSMVFIFVYFLFAKKKPASFESFRAGGRAELTAAQLFAIFLFLWWLPGACVLTFYGPYTMTSNSYFASWAAVILSGLLLGEVFRRVEAWLSGAHAAASDTTTDLRPLLGMVVSSAIVGFSTIRYMPQWGAIYGIVVGFLTCVVTALMYYLICKGRLGLGFKRGAATLLAVLWLATVIILTFDAPFTHTGNGYFSTWFCVICAFAFWYQQIFGQVMPNFVESHLAPSFSVRPSSRREPSLPAGNMAGGGDEPSLTV